MICIADIKPLGYSHAGTFHGKPQSGSHRTRLGTGTEAEIRDGGLFSFCPKASWDWLHCHLCRVVLLSCHHHHLVPKVAKPPGKVWAWENPQLIAVYESWSHFNKVAPLCQWPAAAQPLRTHPGPLVSFGPGSGPCYEPGVAGRHTFTPNTVAPAKSSPLALPILSAFLCSSAGHSRKDWPRQLL